MDCWYRFARKTEVLRSKVAVRRLNVSLAYIKDTEAGYLDSERDRANAVMWLAVLLVRLNSTDSKALEWASAHSRGLKRVTQ